MKMVIKILSNFFRYPARSDYIFCQDENANWIPSNLPDMQVDQVVFY